MARPSLQRIYFNILSAAPNAIGLVAQALIATVRTIPSSAVAEACDKASAAVTDIMNKRGQSIQKTISTLIEMDDAKSVATAAIAKKNAESNVKAVKDSQENIKQEASLQAEKKVLNTNINESTKVIKHETKHKISEEKEIGKNATLREDQKHGHRLEENQTKHKTAWIDNTRIHLDQMTKNVEKLSEAATSASSSAVQNTAATNKATNEIKGLRSEMALVIEATANLTNQLHEYETQETKGNLAIEHAEKIQQTMLHITIAESKLNTKIASSSLEGKADLQQTMTKDIAAKDKDIDTLLAKQSMETITQIHEMTKMQIEKQQESIGAITDLKKQVECQEHLNHLNILLNRTTGIMAQVEEKSSKSMASEKPNQNEPTTGSAPIKMSAVKDTETPEIKTGKNISSVDNAEKIPEVVPPSLPDDTSNGLRH